MHPDTDKWNNRYRDADAAAAHPAQVLVDNAHLLPEGGRALDLACGLGANAMFLARRDFNVRAWDISPVAIDKLKALAAEEGLSMRGEVRDALAQPPAPSSFEVIVVSNYLDRGLFPALSKALTDGGLLFYQTFTRECVDQTGPGKPDYRLAWNELLERCAGMRILVYREEGRIGDISLGFRNQAMLVGQKASEE